MEASGYGLDWRLGGQQAASSLESDMSDGIVDLTVQGRHPPNTNLPSRIAEYGTFGVHLTKSNHQN